MSGTLRAAKLPGGAFAAPCLTKHCKLCVSEYCRAIRAIKQPLGGFYRLGRGGGGQSLLFAGFLAAFFLAGALFLAAFFLAGFFPLALIPTSYLGKLTAAKMAKKTLPRINRNIEAHSRNCSKYVKHLVSFPFMPFSQA